jgi:diguanylate cyclase (GGDEF)-like protein/PAS domain S-box-containing protein
MPTLKRAADFSKSAGRPKLCGMPLPIQLPLPAQTWLPLGLAALAPLILLAISTPLSRRRARGIATVLALRTVVVLSLGFAFLAAVATISVVHTGLRELRERHSSPVRTLARELEQMPLGLAGANAPIGLALFRAKYPTVSFVAVGTDGCVSECLISSADKQSTTDHFKARLGRVWPQGNGSESIVSVDSLSVLLVAEPLHDGSTRKHAVVVVGVDAQYLADQATRTAWILLGIAYALLLIVGYSSWQQLNTSLGSRIAAITKQVREGSVGDESEVLAIDGKELSELAEAVGSYIHNTLEEQKSSDERYRRLVELAPDGFLMCSANGIKFANPAALALAGVRNRYDVIGSPIGKFLEFEPRRAEQAVGVLRPAMWRRVDGTMLHVEVAEISDGSREGREAGVHQYVIRDVTDRRVREAALAHRAEHDALTGLANRARFETRLSDLLDARDRAPESAPAQHVAVLFIDLDGFKPVNDRYGHAAGDAVLVGVAARLRESTRGTDVIARLGGDEFAVLIEVRDQEEVSAVAERILHALKRPILFDGFELTVGASIGIADSRIGDTDERSPDPSDRRVTAAELLRAADAAMYSAKANGGRRYGVTPLSAPAMIPMLVGSPDEGPRVNFRDVA